MAIFYIIKAIKSIDKIDKKEGEEMNEQNKKTEQLREKLHQYVDELSEYGLRYILALIEKVFRQ